jgi:hypothetical protein
MNRPYSEHIHPNSMQANGVSTEERARIVEDPIAQRTKLTALLKAFVARYTGGTTQRSAQWYMEIGITIGGSEIAAVMGWNPYRSRADVVADKSGATVGWDGGSIDCWWGTMFEDVTARFIEIDCGTAVYGSEICIRAIPGHRNSPDGYAVIGMYRADGEWKMWTTDCDFPSEIYYIAMIEIKSPFRRFPDKIPRYYLPQVWSGLVVSPICHFGLFVDGMYRRCTLADLGPSEKYDRNYHSQDKKPLGAPLAWGLTAVYAPQLDAPISLRIKGAVEVGEEQEDDGSTGGFSTLPDVAMEAWSIHSAYFGTYMNRSASQVDIIDFGDCGKPHFDKTMYYISEKQYLTVHTDPCFQDGRGAELQSGATIGRTIDRMRRSSPESYYLLGVMPWKLFLVNYIPIPRRVGFRTEMIEAINSVHKDIAEAKNSGNPAAFLAAQATSQSAEKPSGRHIRHPVTDASEIQDLFDWIGTGDSSAGAAEPAELPREDPPDDLTISEPNGGPNGHANAPSSS